MHTNCEENKRDDWVFSAVKQEEMEDWMAVFTVSALVAYMHACREREVQNLRGESISQCFLDSMSSNQGNDNIGVMLVFLLV